MRWRGLCASLVALVLTVATGARGEDAREQSRAAFLRGVSEAHQGNYSAARDDFLEAYRLFAHPSILLNLGIARWHTGEYVAAEQDLAHFLSDDGGASADEIASARAALAASRAHLGTLEVRVAPEGARAQVDGQAVALVPGSFVDVRAVLGTHALHAEADGHQPVDQTVTVGHDAAATADIALAPLPPPPRAEAPRRSRRRVLVGWSLVSFGAVAAAVGVFAGIEAISYASDYNTRGSSGFQQPDTKSTGIAFRTTADIAFASAVVLGAAGAYLLTAPPGSWPRALAGRVVVGPTFAGVRTTF